MKASQMKDALSDPVVLAFLLAIAAIVGVICYEEYEAHKESTRYGRRIREPWALQRLFSSSPAAPPPRRRRRLPMKALDPPTISAGWETVN